MFLGVLDSSIYSKSPFSVLYIYMMHKYYVSIKAWKGTVLLSLFLLCKLFRMFPADFDIYIYMGVSVYIYTHIYIEREIECFIAN